jgi:phage regulator Rha-like protein
MMNFSAIHPMPTLTASAPSMTSREIADLVESRHDSVKRAIERLAERGVIAQPPVVDGAKSANGVTEKLYFFTGDQGKRDSYVVVAQLSPEFTARLVDRWQELETKVAQPTLPDFTNPAAAARAWASEYEAKQAALIQLEAAQPAIEFHARVGDADDCHPLDEVAKLFRAGPRKFRQALKDLRLLMSNGLPYQEYLNRGYFRVIEQTIPIGGAWKLHAQTFVTGKGLIWLQRRFDHTLLGQET